MQPTEPDDDERIDALPQDNQTPFQPADPANPQAGSSDGSGLDDTAQLDDTHQATDTNLDSHELYDEGVSGAAEASEPNAKDDVVGYTPPSQHNQNDDEDEDDPADVAL